MFIINMKKVIVIGGGFAGVSVVKKLSKRFDVVLIDSKDYFEFTPGILRTLIEPEHSRKIQMKYKDFLKSVEVVIGKVKYADEKIVIINRKSLNYDYLVICSGSRYGAPIKEQDIVLASRVKYLVDSHKKLMGAKNIVIIGGGSVGVELAAEIGCRFENRIITLIHSKDRLIDRNSYVTSNYAYNFLKHKGVNIVLNERVVGIKGKDVITDKGTIIKGDLIFSCIGITPNSEFLSGKLEDAKNENGFIRVNKFLQVKGFDNIFAPGDVNSSEVEKTAQNAAYQAKIVAKNIIALENKNKLMEHDESRTAMVISLGKYDGIFEYGKFVFTGKVPAFLKWVVERREMMRL